MQFIFINKAYKQPFYVTSLQSQAPLEPIYTDVWGSAHSTGIDSSRYYIILVDHYTMYMWFYPMVTKFGVSNIFPHFKKFEKKKFQKNIKSLYSDNGGEFISLNLFYCSMVLSITQLPHTPHNKMESLNDVTVILLKRV